MSFVGASPAAPGSPSPRLAARALRVCGGWRSVLDIRRDAISSTTNWRGAIVARPVEVLTEIEIRCPQPATPCPARQRAPQARCPRPRTRREPLKAAQASSPTVRQQGGTETGSGSRDIFTQPPTRASPIAPFKKSLCLSHNSASLGARRSTKPARRRRLSPRWASCTGPRPGCSPSRVGCSPWSLTAGGLSPSAWPQYFPSCGWHLSTVRVAAAGLTDLGVRPRP
jgi:hypothetical protein